VRLFVQRAAEAKSGFTLSDANASAVARLVRRLDGIPLAIELAAARVRSLTPAELAERLDERFSLLAGGRRTAVERHQTLRRAIDWSYDLLSESEKRTLERPAVFATDFPLSAAEAVITGDEIESSNVVDLLGHLVDKSLVLADDRGGVTRYRLLETIRQYAQERLEEAGEANVLRRRHAEHYASFAEAAGEGLRGRDEAVWTTRVEAELDNLRAALAWAVASGEADLALRLVAPLSLSGTRVGYVTGTWASSVVQLPEASAHPLYPVVQAWAGWAANVAGDRQAGLRLCRQAVEAADAAGLGGRALCRVLALSAGIAAYAFRTDEVERLVGRWIEAARACDDDYELAQALSLAAVVPGLSSRDPAEGAVLGDQALWVARRLGNPTTSSYAAHCAGGARMTADPDRALDLYAEGLAAAESVGNQLGIGMNLQMPAALHVEREEWREAAPFVARATQNYHRAGDHSPLEGCMILAAFILEAVGDDQVAAVLHGTTGVAAHRAHNTPWGNRIAESETALRRRLGDRQFDGCVARGRTLDDDDLVALVAPKLEEVVSEGKLR
jgi:hypothetical protein